MIEIDLRKEVHELIKNYGVYILYIRNSKYMKCKCYNELYKTGDSKCEVCFGSGKITSIELMKCFYNTDKYYSKATGAGKYNVSIGKFIFEYDSLVDFNDLILMVGFKGEDIIDVKQVYKVNNVNDIRCDNGRVEFYEVDIMTDNTLVNKFNRYIKKNKFKKDNFKRLVIGRWSQ